MSTGTNIEWTEATWNPVAGCAKVSEGCRNCYAETMSNRLAGMARADIRTEGDRNPGKKLHHLAVINLETGKWNGTVRLIPEALTEPLTWKKGRRVFVCSMSDLFHKDVPFEYIDRVFAVMALCPQHTFQVLSKRPERMAEYLASRCAGQGWMLDFPAGHAKEGKGFVPAWPLPNVWVGTSVEDQAAADDRIPHLVATGVGVPVRFLSIEPLIGPVDLTRVRWDLAHKWKHKEHRNALDTRTSDLAKKAGIDKLNGIDWVIVGGESGHGARPCDVAWVRSVVEQCKAWGVPCFVKQLGAVATCANDQVSDWLDACHIALDDVDTRGVQMQGDPVRVCLRDRKGGDMSEWPEDLKVRQMPGGVK